MGDMPAAPRGPGSDAAAEFAERIRLLLGNSLFIIVGAHIFCATASLIALTSIGPHPALVPWWLTVIALTVARGLAIARWRRSGVPPARAPAIARGFTVFSILAGAVWGVGAVVFFNPENVPAAALICVVLAGMAAGGIGPVAAYFPAYAAFATAALMPMSIALFLYEPGVLWFFGAFGVILLVTCLGAAAFLERRIRESIALRFDNRHLISRLEAKRREAERANEAKGRFLAAASHDLRQPLNSLSLAVEMLDEARGTSAHDELVRSIRSSVNATNDLLTGLLDVSRLDAGVVRVEPRYLRLATMLAHIESIFEPVARERAVSLRIRPTGAMVHSDPALLSSILQNLVGNAIRYAPNGGRVLVAARRRGRGWRVEVRDNGSGISPDQQQRVFEDFARCHPDQSDGGLGLGLAIVRRATELLGHTLQLRSAPGRGSTFAVVLESAGTDIESPRAAASTDLVAARATLLIAPEPERRQRLRALLEARGMRVDAPAAIEDASEALASGALQPAVLIVDGHGHGTFDGVDAVRWLTGRAAGRLPALLITGDISPGLRRRARAGGITLVRRPLDPERLTGAITEAIAG